MEARRTGIHTFEDACVAWVREETPRGWRALSATDHRSVGLLQLCTALSFFALAGVLALLMRYQLAAPDAGLLRAGTYDQLFSMHGVAMMLLFGVPIVQAIGVRLLPPMLGARDLPFPRLAAFACWMHAAGGILLCATLLFGVAPDAGWIPAMPLSGYQTSPGISTDYWLTGAALVAISALAGAVQLVVAVLRTRAPGMSLGRMPPYAWGVLIAGAASAVAFAPLLVAIALLALERALHWPFFIGEKGGDVLLWRHLSRLFAYLSWCILLLPVAGLVSTMVTGLARVRLVGYAWVVAAFVAAAAIGFGVPAVLMLSQDIAAAWPDLAAAAQVLFAVPGAIVISAWIATLMRGSARLSVPALHLLGGICMFSLGGLAGVLAAALPSLQDTYFAVAQTHFLAAGGLLLPLCAALYYWGPPAAGASTQALGRLGFAVVFAGLNLCFLPMLVMGLAGMPRRIYTYAPGLGLEWWNQLSAAGAFLLAAGFCLVLVDGLRHLRVLRKPGANPWGAAGLEWLPRDRGNLRSLPQVHGRYPLWDQPALDAEVDNGAHHLPSTPDSTASTLVTSAIMARPEYVLRLPRATWMPMLTAFAAAGACFLLASRMPGPAAGAALLALAGLVAWMWQCDRPPWLHRGSAALPMAARPPSRPHAWWAMLVALAASAVGFMTLAFCYGYLWTMAGGPWPPREQPLPILSAGAVGVILWVTSSALFTYAGSMLHARMRAILVLAVALVVNLAALAVTTYGFLAPGLAPQSHASAALAGAMLAFQALHCMAAAIMVGFLAARTWTGLLGPLWRTSFDNVRLYFQYVVVQGVVAATLLYLLPRLGV
jgi:cytochrome c oxidase subunit I+III